MDTGGDRLAKKDRTVSVKTVSEWLTKHSARVKLFGKSAIVISAVTVIVVGLLSLRGRPAAVPFTRVGGTRSVETAVDASRFWLTPPRRVVETPFDISQTVMLGAARCAMENNAPLLLISADRKAPRPVRMTIDSWWSKAAAKARTIVIFNQTNVYECLARKLQLNHPVKVSGLSLLKVPGQQQEFPEVGLPAQQALAPFVVFAASWARNDSPDVDVGLALAAHLAPEELHGVSLVVIQRYLEADPDLVNQLQKPSEQVTGGVVLGQNPTVPGDTRALLRQLLSSPNWLAQLIASLTPLGALAVGILALLGLFTTAAPAAGEQALLIVQGIEKVSERRRVKRTEPPNPPTEDEGSDDVSTNKDDPGSGPQAPDEPDWVPSLSGKHLIVWLRSGSEITGDIDGLQVVDVDTEQAPAKQPLSHLRPGRRGGSAYPQTLTFLRIRNATLPQKAHDQPQEAELVLVPVERIELIVSGLRESQTEGNLQPLVNRPGESGGSIS
jgi:hypothetical protein